MQQRRSTLCQSVDDFFIRMMLRQPWLNSRQEVKGLVRPAPQVDCRILSGLNDLWATENGMREFAADV
ncbi:MAG: hypothetical protein EBR09_08925 [Proteobacteria bacterium]|nr:hypothetical protein [Pseudomonadota bacterium]